MSNLIVIATESPAAAYRLRNEIVAMQHDYSIETEDLVVVTRGTDGRVKLHQPVNMVVARGLGGAVWGLGLGAVFLIPLVGAVVGAAVGALTGYYSDVGIDDRFLRTQGHRLPPGTAAVALMARQADPEALAALLRRHGGAVLRAALSAEIAQAMPPRVVSKRPTATHAADFRSQPAL